LHLETSRAQSELSAPRTWGIPPLHATPLWAMAEQDSSAAITPALPFAPAQR
jgi:hypothetical protein